LGLGLVGIFLGGNGMSKEKQVIDLGSFELEADPAKSKKKIQELLDAIESREDPEKIGSILKRKKKKQVTLTPSPKLSNATPSLRPDGFDPHRIKFVGKILNVNTVGGIVQQGDVSKIFQRVNDMSGREITGGSVGGKVYNSKAELTQALTEIKSRNTPVEVDSGGAKYTLDLSPFLGKIDSSDFGKNYISNKELKQVETEHQLHQGDKNYNSSRVSVSKGADSEKTQFSKGEKYVGTLTNDPDGSVVFFSRNHNANKAASDHTKSQADNSKKSDKAVALKLAPDGKITLNIFTVNPDHGVPEHVNKDDVYPARNEIANRMGEAIDVLKDEIKAQENDKTKKPEDRQAATEKLQSQLQSLVDMRELLMKDTFNSEVEKLNGSGVSPNLTVFIDHEIINRLVA
jgi:hypothetical protein